MPNPITEHAAKVASLPDAWLRKAHADSHANTTAAGIIAHHLICHEMNKRNIGHGHAYGNDFWVQAAVPIQAADVEPAAALSKAADLPMQLVAALRQAADSGVGFATVLTMLGVNGYSMELVERPAGPARTGEQVLQDLIAPGTGDAIPANGGCGCCPECTASCDGSCCDACDMGNCDCCPACRPGCDGSCCPNCDMGGCGCCDQCGPGCDGSCCPACGTGTETDETRALAQILAGISNFLNQQTMEKGYSFAHENTVISRNRRRKEAAAEHDFTPAKYHTRKGLQRCLTCGQPAPAVGKTCNSKPLAARLVMKGDFARWNTASGPGQGRVEDIDGEAAVRVFKYSRKGWLPSEEVVILPVEHLTPITPLVKAAPTKTEAGTAFPAEAYAYVPDPESPSTWKLRLWETPDSRETARQVGMAVAALGPGFRGNKVDIPAADLPKVKAKVRAAWAKANPGKDAKDAPTVLKADTFNPPQAVRDAAARALQWVKDGKAGDGFTATGRARAVQLATGMPVSLDTLKRMASFFARHSVDRDAPGFKQGDDNYPSGGRVAWDAWGGDAGAAWVKSVMPDTQKAHGPHSFAEPETGVNCATCGGKKDSWRHTITKVADMGVVHKEDERRYTLGPMYVPNTEDAHGEWTDDTILQEALWKYVRSGGRDIRLQHNREVVAGEWVEVLTWPYPIKVPLEVPGESTQQVEFPANTVFMGIVWEPWAWEMVKAGKLRGLSIGGKAVRIDADIPEAETVTMSDPA